MGAAAAAALLCCAWSGAASAEPASARAEAELITPLTIASEAPLSFGTIAAGGSAGTIVIDPDSESATATGGVVMIGGASPASFTGTALAGKHVKVRVPKGAVLLRRVGGAETMTAGAFTVTGKRNDIVVFGGVFSFKVGATLSVGASQAEGVYEGSFEVTVENF